MDIFDLLIWIFKQVRKARAASVAQEAGRRAQFGQAMSQLGQRTAAPIYVTPPVPTPSRAPAPTSIPIVVTPTGFTRAVPASAVVPMPVAAPSAEGLLVSGLFTQPRSLVAAFVASELLGPPVAFRGH
jgi:hypothetical protein